MQPGGPSAAASLIWMPILGVLSMLVVAWYLLGPGGPIPGQQREHAVRPIPVLLAELVPELPFLLEASRLDLESLTASMHSRIGWEIDSAFAVVHRQMPIYLDFHYSVLGEYAELAATFSTRIDGGLQRILIEESGLDEAIDVALQRISVQGDDLVGLFLQRLRHRLADRLSLTPPEITLVSELARLSLDDTLDRFGSSELLFRGGAAVAGGAVGARFAAAVAARVAGRGIAKAGGKMALKSSGLGGGATGGALAGLLCGPGAMVCVPAAAVVAGAAAWFATDKVLVEVDELLYREAFEGEILALLQTERDRLVDSLMLAFREHIHAILDQAESDLQALSTFELIDGVARR